MVLKPNCVFVIQDFKGGSFKKAPRSNQPVIFPEKKALAVYLPYFYLLLVLTPWTHSGTPYEEDALICRRALIAIPS